MPLHYTHDQLLNAANFQAADIDRINLCGRSHNKLGFGYQLAFVRLFNRFPNHPPFEVIDDILAYAGMQLSIPSDAIHRYSTRFQTIYEHQDQIRDYLGFKKLDDADLQLLKQFIFDDPCRLEQSGALMARATEYLRDKRILTPSEDTLRRLIGAQKEGAKKHIFKRISDQLSISIKDNLDNLIGLGDRHQTEFNILKLPPSNPSPQAINKLTEKLDRIESTGVMQADLSWLNNNFQRMLAHQVRHYTVTRVRRLVPVRRYAAMACFLQQNYQDTVDYLVDMFDKLVNRI